MDERYFLHIFNPTKITKNQSIPSLVITDLKILNESVKVGQKINEHIPLERNIEYTNDIILSYKDIVFSLEFTALEFTSPEDNKYAYMLE